MNGLIVHDALGERRFTAEDLPLSLGGQGAAILLNGLSEGAHAYLGAHEGRLFLQPAPPEQLVAGVEPVTLLHNGLQRQGSCWLDAGDVIDLASVRLRLKRAESDAEWLVLDVEDGSAGNITAPPVITAGDRLQGHSDGAAERVEAVRFQATQPANQGRTLNFDLRRIGAGIAAVLVLAVMWFLFTATAITLQADPADAQVRVTGGFPVVNFGERALLRPGDYQVRAAREGHEAVQVPVTVTDARNQVFAVTLPRLPGQVQVITPEPMQLSVDGEVLGETPGEFQLAAGAREISITSERYQPFTATLDVVGGGERQEFTPELVANFAPLEIITEPAGAQASIAGQVLGTTPLTANVPAGQHTIELQLTGFKPWRADVLVKANEPQSVGPVQLGLPDARLAVRSQPAGASVSVAGVYKGRTPLTLELAPQLAHTVSFALPGHESASRQVSLQAGASSDLSVTLQGIYGEVRIVAQPADAEVFVNGRAAGRANQTLRLVATPQQLEIRKAGLVTYKTEITPRPGVAQTIEATLLTPQQSQVAAIAPTLRSKAGQQLRLMPAGSYTMGSPRREPGRRANEAQRPVTLQRLFYLSLHEVTNEQYRAFKAAHNSGLVGQHSLDLDNQPVVNVSWQDAAAYCNWLSAQEGLPPAYENRGGKLVAVQPLTTGYRLPTDAEWEWAARNDGKGGLLRYPWGMSLPVTARSGNYADTSARLLVQDVIADYDDGFPASAPVGRFPVNALGLFDMGGNVAEWVHDLYTVTLASGEAVVDPTGPEQGGQYVIRGSSWRHSNVTDLRLSARGFGEQPRNDTGFRIARYAQ